MLKWDCFYKQRL